jgi:hypothetical protein
MDAFVHFLAHFQKENFTDGEAKQLVEVIVSNLFFFLQPFFLMFLSNGF